jgi:uncharacterized membrane protein
MKPTRESLLAVTLLAAVLAVNAAGLWPELSVSRVDLNDNVFHFTLIERMVQAVERGESPLDGWSPEWSLGYPVLRTYQPLAHILVTSVYLALHKSVDLMTVFVWVRFLAVLLLPLSFFACVRLMGLPPLTAAAAAVLAPLVSTNFLYGMEYGSFVWAGSGLFPQALASHLLLLTLGLSFQAIKRGKHVVLAGAMLGLTALAHLIYGYIGGLSLILLAVLPDETNRSVRIFRTLQVGATAMILSAFQIVPLLLDSSNINHSRWEPVWKWDSFGAAQVSKWLGTGELLDHGRLPVLTLLAFAGAALYLWNTFRHQPGNVAKQQPAQRRPVCAAHMFALAGAAFWILMFFGRPFWGPALTILGVSGDMQLHRVIGGAHVFLVLLAAIALAALWREMSRRWNLVAAVAITAVLLYPAVRERAVFLSHNEEWGRKNLAAYQANRPFIEQAVAVAKRDGGRAYAGLAASWGGQFKVGDVPFFAFLSEANVPAVSFLYHSMALTADIMVRFDELNPSHYALFNIHTVIAPVAPSPPLPPFLRQVDQFGPFRVLQALPSSYFDVVEAHFSVKTTRANFYDINDRWLHSDWVARGQHLLLDWRGDTAARLLPLAPEEALPALPPLPRLGKVDSEAQDGDLYRAKIETPSAAYVLFKMTWHPHWKAYIDGQAQTTVMLSPGFVGVPVTPGVHEVVLRFEPDSHKGLWALIGLFGVLLALGAERSGWLARATQRMPAWEPAVVPRKVWTAAGLVLLAAPICIPLLTGSVLWGHDAFEYFPRIVEVHENVLHGNLWPRWAPDLGGGTGQPLFLFRPPLIYVVGELWHLVGFDVVTAVNLACIVVVLASAGSMFLLARLYFGDAGGWLGAAAYVYFPYFSVDLFVRSALEEFAAFPLFALALYGFGAYARDGKRKHQLLGAAAYAALLTCHFPAALQFTPLLVAFLIFSAWMEGSWAILRRQALGFAVGLGLSAFVWLPALVERQYVRMDRLLEGALNYTNHFVYLNQLFYSPWGYGLSVPGPNDGMSFALGWSHLLLAILVWVWIARNPKLLDRRLLHFFAAAAAVLCFLMLEDALWIWQQIPLLQMIEFPWRILGPVAVCVALLVAPLGKLLASTPRWRTCGMTAALALLIVPNLSHLHASRTADVDLQFWTPLRLATTGFESTTMGEVAPRWITATPAYSSQAVKVLSGDAQVESPGRTPFRWTSLVKAKTESTLEVSTAWFPGWDVQVDGHSVDAGPGGRGLITFRVPSGDHTLAVSYGRSGLEEGATGISILALIFVGAALLRSHALQTSSRHRSS